MSAVLVPAVSTVTEKDVFSCQLTDQLTVACHMLELELLHDTAEPAEQVSGDIWCSVACHLRIDSDIHSITAACPAKSEDF